MCMLIIYTQEYKYFIPVGQVGKTFYSVKLGDLQPLNLFNKQPSVLGEKNQGRVENKD